MSLVPGSRVGPYEVLSPPGAERMGEVHRVRDTRIDREMGAKASRSLVGEPA